jgi:cobaltochelatase CobS
MSVTLQHELATVKAKCMVCFKQIEKGEPIRLVRKFANGTQRWAHADCYHAAPGGDGDGEDNHPAPAPAADLTEDAKERIVSLTSRVEQLEAKLEQSGGFKVLEIRQPDRDPVRIEGAVHPIFPEVIELASVREDIFLPGPAGCGKSHLAKQVADALGLRFGSISCSAGMSESQLLGRCVPAGEHGQFEFQGTQFLDCYENGGVFLFDEIDAADSNVLLVINSALANGHMSVPSRHAKPVAKRHPDFICIAAANTFGRGADRQYMGRNQLDESTLDRFRIGTVPMDYDEGLERQLCPDAELYARLRTYRENARRNRLERIVSTRFVIKAYRMVQAGWSYDKVDSKLFSGWREDEIRKAKG